MWSRYPCESAKTIRRGLMRGAEDLGARGRDDEYGHGLVDAAAAYQFVSRHTRTTFEVNGVVQGCPWLAKKTAYKADDKPAVIRRKVNRLKKICQRKTQVKAQRVSVQTICRRECTYDAEAIHIIT